MTSDSVQVPLALDRLRLLESVVEHAPDAVLITEAECVDSPGPKIVYVNPAFTAMSGYTREEAIGKTPRILQGARTDRAALDRIRDGLRRLQPIREELINYRKDGAEYWVELSIVPVFDDQGQCRHFVGIQRDVSNRKRAEEDLQASQRRTGEQEEQLRLALSAAHMSSWQFDYRTNAIEYTVDTLGLGPGPVSEPRSLDPVDPRDRELVHHAAMRSRTEGVDLQLEFRGSRSGPNGEIKWYASQGRVHRDERGELARMVGVTWDITQMKKVEASLAKQVRYQRAIAACSQELIRPAQDEETFHAILTTALAHLREAAQSDRIALMRNIDDGASYRIIAESFQAGAPSTIDQPALSPVSWRTIPSGLRDQLSAGDIVSVPISDIRESAPELADAAVLAGVRSVLAYAIHVDNLWWGFVCLADAEEHRVWEDQDALLVRTATQMIAAFVQRYLDREALRESEERFRLATDMTRSLVYEWDIASGKVYRSESLLNILGYEAHEVTPDAAWWFDRVHPDDRHLYAAAHVTDYDCECRVRHKQGHYVWVWDRAHVHRDSSGTPRRVLGITVDITLRKELAQERETMMRRLQETQKLESLGVLAGGVAHDFNNLLTTILGNAGLARIRLSQGASAERFLDEIETACRRAADLCQQMLAYAGKGRFVIALVDLNQIIRETTNLLRVSVGRNCVLHLDLATGLPGVQADPTQLRQILMNVALNASEAIGEKQGRIRISTRRGGDAGSPTVILEVEDNGEGMSPEIQARMFEPFYTTKFTGRGLGLAATQGIIKSHGGTIDVASRPGQGTTICISLPATTEAPAAPPPRRTNGLLKHQPKGRILVVDDEAPVRIMLNGLLRELGYDVVLAHDGLDALGKIDNEFRLVLLDMTMPVYSGERTLNDLRTRGVKVPIVLMSGYNEQEMRERFQGKHIAGFLQKPFDIETLLDVLHVSMMA